MARASKYAHYSQIDPSYASIQKDLDAAINQLWALPLDQMRAALLQPPALPDDIPTDLDITESNVSVRDGTKIGIRVYKKKGSDKKSKEVLFFSMHGGGWTVGSHGVEEIMNRYVASKNSVVVISPDYRLAPEYRFPYAVNDCFDVLKWCKQNADQLGIDAERIIVGGGSAGGNLAAVLSLKARDEGLSGIIGQVLNNPVTCHPKLFPKDKYEFNSWEQNKDVSAFLKADVMMWFWDCYLPNVSAEVYASPLLAESFENLPPALIQVGGMDPLRDEGIAYAEALKTSGVPVQLEVYAGLPHGFGSLIPLKDTVIKANTTVVDFVRGVTIGSKSRL